MDLFLVLDGHSLIYRSIFAPGQPLTSPSGEPTRGPYVLLQTLGRLLDDFQPTHLACALDPPRGSTFRKELFPGYKANRAEKDPAVLRQVQRCRELVAELGIRCVEAPGFEADDVVATMVGLTPIDARVVVVSRDKDLHQLVRDAWDVVCAVAVHDVFAGRTYDAAAVREKWGVGPRHVIELMTLAGDPTDGVSGVRGIGPKKALDLVRRHGSVSALRALLDSGRADEVLTESVRKKLLAADLDLCRRLVALRDDVPLPGFDFEACAWSGMDLDRAAPLFRELGFKSWMIAGSGPRPSGGRGPATSSSGLGFTPTRGSGSRRR